MVGSVTERVKISKGEVGAGEDGEPKLSDVVLLGGEGLEDANRRDAEVGTFARLEAVIILGVGLQFGSFDLDSVANVLAGGGMKQIWVSQAAIDFTEELTSSVRNHFGPLRSR